jgi:hypothetical protein
VNTISGVIDSIYTKEVQIKNGPRAGQTSTVYHAMIQGHDVNLGFKCDYQEGESVTLTVEEKYGGYQVVKGNGNANAPSVPNAASQAGPAQPAAPLGPKPAAFPTPKNTKDISIIRQNSMTHATRIVDDMIIHGVVKAPKTEGEYVEKVIEVAYQVFDFSSGWREQKMADAQAAYQGEE